MSEQNFPNPKKFTGQFFIIHAMPRTASTSVRSWLNKQNGVMCHGEILGQNKVNGTSNKIDRKYSTEERDSAPHKFAKDYFCASSEQTVGFKALSSHLLDPTQMPFLKWFFETQPKMIGLYRTDLVTRFRSTIYFRFKSGRLNARQIQRLKTNDVLINCVQTYEEWKLANNFWGQTLDSVCIDIKNIDQEAHPAFSALLNTDLKGQVGRANSATPTTNEDGNEEVIAHLSEICDASVLDPYRDIGTQTI